MAQLTKAQLLVEIEQLRIERQRLIVERDEAIDGLHRLKSELLASKLPAPVEQSPFRIVTIRGERFAKVPSTVGGRTVITYKPLGAQAS